MRHDQGPFVIDIWQRRRHYQVRRLLTAVYIGSLRPLTALGSKSSRPVGVSATREREVGTMRGYFGFCCDVVSGQCGCVA